MLRLLALLLALAAPAQAANVFVSPSGSDANDCLSASAPCQTLQAAADRAGQYGNVMLADGTYTAGAYVHYFRMVRFTGNCATPGAVVISTPGTMAFTAEDHAILTVQCVDIVGTDARAIFARQFAIVDAAYVRFGPMVTHVIANEMSKVNVASPTLLAGYTTYSLRANSQSQIIVGGTITLQPGVSFYAYAYAAYLSMIDASGLSVSGSATGINYIVAPGSLLAPPPGGLLGSIAGQCPPGCLIQ